jgi:hypothetical protein
MPKLTIIFKPPDARQTSAKTCTDKFQIILANDYAKIDMVWHMDFGSEAAMTGKFKEEEVVAKVLSDHTPSSFTSSKSFVYGP